MFNRDLYIVMKPIRLIETNAFTLQLSCETYTFSINLYGKKSGAMEFGAQGAWK